MTSSPPPGVTTRFAPSPTGTLHLGGARTALFNLLFARHHGGRFILRIDDTDRARSTEPAVAAILDGLAWLGVAWDEGPIFQHARIERHVAAVHRLLAEGKAYRCYATAEELEEMRLRAVRAHKPPRYDGTWRHRDPDSAPPGVAPVIRLAAPESGVTVIDDLVLGRVDFANADLDDMVLLRGDGSPTYMLSTVIDDHDTGVTHVIRGNEHFTNAARQAQLYDAFGWPRPIHAHLPLIHGADGTKLSKRHGAVGLEAYRDLGFLPEAMADYLIRLGWSGGGDGLLDLAEAAKLFDLDHIGRSPARFDMEALTGVNFRHMKAATDERLVAGVMPLLPSGAVPADVVSTRLTRLMPGLKERAKTLVHLAETAGFLAHARPLARDAAAEALLDGAARDRLARLRPVLAAVAPWEQGPIDAALKGFVAGEGLKFPQLAQPLRAALTGRTNSPGIADVLAVLGRDESLGRVDDVLTVIGSS